MVLCSCNLVSRYTHGHILNILDLFSNGHTYLNILNRLAAFPFFM